MLPSGPDYGAPLLRTVRWVRDNAALAFVAVNAAVIVGAFALNAVFGG